MIDRRELLEKARERNVSLQMVEKDYVLGWLLSGLSKFDGLVFKGGTALSKIYLPETWRLSEDLDFAFTGKDFSFLLEGIPKSLQELSTKSGMRFEVRNQFTNPEYMQLKIRYEALLSITGQRWMRPKRTCWTRHRSASSRQRIPITRISRSGWNHSKRYSPKICARSSKGKNAGTYLAVMLGRI